MSAPVHVRHLFDLKPAGEELPLSDVEAAAEGNAEAQAGLGAMYAKGDGVPKSYAEAIKWYRLAADQGDAAAQQRATV